MPTEQHMRQLQPVLMEGVKIIFRNFKGEQTKFSPEGTRTFGVLLPEDLAEIMRNDGWNVKDLKPSEEEREQGIEKGPPMLPVEAAFHKGRPPKIVLITSGGRTVLDDETVKELDSIDIAVDDDGNPKCDLIVNPRFWGPNATGDMGVKAYLKSMYITADEDELDKKYSSLPSQQQ